MEISSPPPLDPASLRELLLFYADAGADEALLDEPVDRLAEVAATMAARAQPMARELPRQTPAAPAAEPARPMIAMAVPDDAQIARARDMAREARTLEELRDILAGFDGCNLKFTAKQLVFSDGNAAADLMLVGEAPGRDEDIEGLPFAGRTGSLLDRMLAAIGINRSDSAYIANVVSWRPPGNRAPTPLETEICRPFIERQIELANPKVLVTLGGAPAKVLLDANDAVLRLRGTWKVHRTQSGIEIPTMPTLHPLYLLRNPAHKKLVWRDLLEIRAKLETLRG
jgi:uracil-DNA glycosylase family 4